MTSVLKFGGSVLRDAKDVERMGKILSKRKDVVVVLSAFYGMTERITEAIDCAVMGRDFSEYIDALEHDLAGYDEDVYSAHIEELKKNLEGIRLLRHCAPSIRDRLLPMGEKITVAVAIPILKKMGLRVEAVDSAQHGLVTDGSFGRASIVVDQSRFRIGQHLTSLLMDGTIPVVTGFFGIDVKGRVNVLGLGGSDYTATALGEILDCTHVELWKDVEGFRTADPKVVPEAKIVSELSYDEAGEMAYFGAKILHPRAIEPAKNKGFPIHIVDFKKGQKRTVISSERGQKSVKAVAFTRDVCILHARGYGIGYKPGILGAICNGLFHKDINIKSAVTAQTCIALLLEKRDGRQALEILRDLNIDVVEKLEIQDDVAIVALIGDKIISTKGVAARSFSAVAKAGMNVLLIDAGPSNSAWYFVVSSEEVEKCVKAIHRELIAGKRD